MIPKKIIYLTTSRSDYDLIKPLIIQNKRTNKILLITGSHLEKKFGNTISQIKRDKLNVNKIIKIDIQTKNRQYMINNSIAIGLNKFSKSLIKEKPDLVIILGDRFEALSFAIACYTLKYPIAHLHGGEITKGSLDNGFRNSITKMSRLHFVSNFKHKIRLINMGEKKKDIYDFGSLGVENALKIKLKSKSEIQKKLKFTMMKNNLLVCFHPNTTFRDKKKIKKEFSDLISALRKFKEIYYIFTSPNNDPGGLEIMREIKKFVKKNKNAIYFPNLGQKYFFSILKQSDGMIGNSSSGIIECPAYKKGSINIGDRQSGRLKSSSVIDSNSDTKSIITAIKKLYSKKFQSSLKKTKNIYQKKNTCFKINNIILNYLK
tara:strand:- start:554 stop:1678 length:1125 start_codon:yes stop_codon:yes gene_type:complete